MDDINFRQTSEDPLADDGRQHARKPYSAPTVQTAESALNALLASGCPPEAPLQE